MKGGVYMIVFFEKKLIFVLSAIVCILSGAFSIGRSQEVHAEEYLDMYSGSYALTDGDTGRVLTGKQETSPMANASTTKILTCIIALENCNLDEMVTISSNAVTQPKVRLGMQVGERYTLKDMLYGLMLESYNDCAVAIAEHVAGSKEAFADMMNQKAMKIGCKDTYFITPNGLDAEDSKGFHHTTASDLCRIMAYCTWESPMRNQFLEITQTRNYSVVSEEKTYSFTNHNTFLNQMDGVLTGKTGFTNKAGYCYVAALEHNGEKYCIALLACGWPNNKNYKWKDARKLLEYGLEQYNIETVAIEPLEKTIWIDGYTNNSSFMDLNQAQQISVYADRREYHILLAEAEKLRREIVLYTETVLPIEEGQKMGVCNIYLEDTLLDSFEINARNSAKDWNMLKIWEIVMKKFFDFS